MVYTTSGLTSDEYTQHETYYTTQYAQWNGLVSRNTLLRQIIEIRAASVFGSWTTKGPHEKEAKRMLEKLRGRNGETLKQILGNMYKIAYICGDSYAEIIWDEDGPEKGLIERLEILPSDNIRQVIKKGKIIRYEEIDGKGSWDTSDMGTSRIFHIKYNPRGAMTHGLGMIESMNNQLLSREQMSQIGQQMYERMSAPKQIIMAKTDNKEKLQMIRDAIKEAGDSWSGTTVLPWTLIDKVEDIQLTVSLKPQEWMDYIDKDIHKSTATPEIFLGQGYANSDVSFQAHLAGFSGSIRNDQEWWEDDIERQLFTQIWPTNTPTIEFSYTAEAYDAMYNRIMQSIPTIEASTVLAPDNKEIMIKEKFKEAGLIT